MKKIAALLAGLLLALSLGACAGGGGGAAGGQVTLPETVLADEKGIKAVVKGFGKYEGPLFPSDHALLIDVTNGTDRTVEVGLTDSSVNGCMIQTNISVNVKPGETLVYPASFDEAALRRYGITTYREFEFRLEVEDDETYETVLLTPLIQLRTSAAEDGAEEFDESGDVIYDADGLKVVARPPYEDPQLGLCVDLAVSNRGDQPVSVVVARCLLNGKETDPYYGSDVMPGKHSLDVISFDQEDVPEKLESLTLSLNVYQRDTGDLLVENTPPVTVNFPKS